MPLTVFVQYLGGRKAIRIYGLSEENVFACANKENTLLSPEAIVVFGSTLEYWLHFIIIYYVSWIL